MTRLSQAIGHTFSDSDLLKQALTHRSAASRNNERLEFLGDAVLGLVVAEILYQRFPNNSEGELSRLRSHLVKGKTLAGLGLKLDLSEHVLLGSGEKKCGGQKRESILADAVEAIIGAIYIDAGLDAARSCIQAWYGDSLKNISIERANKDPKTQLQEYLQGRGLSLPNYRVVATAGEEHNQVFHVQCELGDINIKTEGRGSSRRKAEQDAAEAALQKLS